MPPAELFLHIISESVGRRTLSLYQKPRAAEKELAVSMHTGSNHPETVQTFSTSVTRSYLDNPLTALAKSVERDADENEMRKPRDKPDPSPDGSIESKHCCRRC